MTETNTATETEPKPCPAYSPGGEYCPWCHKFVGEHGWKTSHTPKPKTTPAPAAAMTPVDPPMLFDHLAEIGFSPNDDGHDDTEDFPSWVFERRYDAITVSERSRWIVGVTIDDDEGATIYVLSAAGVLLTAPMTFAADEIGTRLFLVTVAEVAHS